MKKNTIIKVLSVIMLLAVIVSAVGCSGKDNGSVKDGEVGIVDVDKLDQENGTAVYERTEVNKDTGKTEVVTEVIDVEEVNTPVVGDELIKEDTDKEAFIQQQGPNNYGMSEEEAKDVIENAENWKTFYILHYVENKTDSTMVCKSVDAKKGDGIFIKPSLDAEYGIGAGGFTQIAIRATYDANKYKTEEELSEAFSKLDIKIQYALTDDPYAEIDDWDSVTTKVIEVNK